MNICPKISIITVNLNNGIAIRKTIESVINQTFTDYEYIVIDGGSKDGSLDVIKEYADKISYWISEPDNGIYHAMNKGILKAKGEYCLFLNSGDSLYSEDILEHVFDMNCTQDIITGDMLKLYSDGTTELDKGQAWERNKNGKSLTLYDMITGTLNHSSSLIKRSLFDAHGLYDENYRIVSDWIFFLKTVGLCGIKVQYVDLILSVFDMNGISNTRKKLLVQERKKAIESVVPESIYRDYYDIIFVYFYIFESPFTFFVARALNKIIRFFRFRK